MLSLIYRNCCDCEEYGFEQLQNVAGKTAKSNRNTQFIERGMGCQDNLLTKMEHILFGTAYYDEYMPEERLEKDMQMMRDAGINVIRIAESTWASEEPREGEFDFSHVTRVIEAASCYGISVIVGTPTYAIPPWLWKKYPSILATTEMGEGRYGARQIMDITNPYYRKYAERIIRKLIECVHNYSNVIGYQIDNETKHYHVAGERVQKLFVQYLKRKFGTVDALNKEFGFAYWSNNVDCWENVPDVTGTINGSFMAEFEKFRRMLVDEFLLWQRRIIEEYRRPDQFVTHNFDFEWREHSFGVQPDVNHFHAAKAITVAGCDIYHESQDKLTGREAAFCGAITRALKKDNYLVLETNAQGHLSWTPYDGQLRMQAFSHLANGANAVMYWHWHSIHNAMETYWRGILSHDMEENRIYREVTTIGKDIQRIEDSIFDLKKDNKVAILVSNESLTALSKSPMFPLPGGEITYNDIVRQYADALYDINVEYDIVSSDERDFSAYRVVIAPALYSAEDSLLDALKAYVEKGGYLIGTFKMAYANEYLTVSHEKMPHILHECFGVTYQEYTIPGEVYLKVAKDWIPEPIALLSEEERKAHTFMELLIPEGCNVLATYEHPHWNQYAAITEHAYGEGKALYVGCMTTESYVKEIMSYVAKQLGMFQNVAKVTFPINIKHGINKRGKRIHYYFNYSDQTRLQKYFYENARELLSDTMVQHGETLTLSPWSVYIYEETQPYFG